MACGSRASSVRAFDSHGFGGRRTDFGMGAVERARRRTHGSFGRGSFGPTDSYLGGHRAGVGVRQIHRLLIRFREDGGGSLIHKSRGQPSNHSLSSGVRDRLVCERIGKGVSDSVDAFCGTRPAFCLPIEERWISRERAPFLPATQAAKSPRAGCFIDIAVWQLKSSNPFWVFCKKELSDKSSAVIANEIDCLNSHFFEKRLQHFYLCLRRDVLAGRDLDRTEAHHVTARHLR